MKKMFIAIALIASVVFLSSSQKDEPDDSCGDGVSRKSAGPPSCNAGEPPLLTSCGSAGCHDDSPLNSGSAQVNLNLGGADVNYTPGQQYTVTVSISRTGLARGGFQIVALQDNNISISPGIITLTELTRTQRIDAAHPHSGGCATQNKVWIEHTSSGIDNVTNNTIQWQFNWQAPATDVGSITFYLAALDANKDIDNTGDFAYTLSKTISATPVGIQDVSTPRINIFPNPAGSFISIETDHPVSIHITNVLGESLSKQNFQSSATIDISELNSGIYFVRDENNILLGKFVKE